VVEVSSHDSDFVWTDCSLSEGNRRLLCSSTASVESDTLTTVASSCERSEPSTAADVIFQASGSSQSASLGTSLNTLDKGGDDLVSGADPGQTREGLFKRKTVLFGILTGASVFDKQKGKAEAGALARSGLDA
jgi:hypothetical protein